ncbi:S41 family peptidase [Sphaerotilus mobilis]|uniref:S41A family C-terminal processing peptidase-3 n=1 Tax=Sphaerotilus mobilis TaxID=47994 RepID=A0A4Q7LUG7_9BURK|nr:S41 family peptidase [Sphaerotilus mobilis]RZS57862.1 S41A family C-terminal processing peptidase-3 [Sphaerotilus mobilis]
MGSKLKVAGWVLAGAVAGALATMQLQATARSAMSPLPIEDMQQLAAVFDLVKRSYVEPVDEKKLIRDAIGGMVAGLDPHSAYFEGQAFKEFHEGISGKFTGVGIQIEMEDGLVKVVSPIEGSPAFRAGLQTGDLITRIDDTAVKGLTMDQAIKRMRGPSNTKVMLTILRKSENRTFPVSIVREEIKTKSVRSKVVEPGYAWIRINQFQEPTLRDFAEQLKDIFKQEPGLKGLVLDLRNDPGGLLDVAVGVSAAFLPRDAIVVTTNGQIAESRSTLRAAPAYYSRDGNDVLASIPALIKNVPVVVLVNEGSASASEIVAGALKDHKRAVIMGSQTFGKGSVQSELTRLPMPNTSLKITTARYYTPSGQSIQAKGIVPDVLVDETAEGSPFAALRMREADLDRHLGASSGASDAKKDAAREKAREEALRKLEEANNAAGKDKAQPRLPEFGSNEDFQLQQALNRLKGKSVQVSKTQVERKAGEATNN